MIYRYGAAKARVKLGRVADVCFDGPLSLDAVGWLGWSANAVICGDPKVVRVDKALFCFSRHATLDELANSGEGLYGAIVCRPDQMQTTREFCALAAAVGVLRVAFLCPSLALEWASGFA